MRSTDVQSTPLKPCEGRVRLKRASHNEESHIKWAKASQSEESRGEESEVERE